MATTSQLPQPDSIEYWKSLYDDMGELYGQEAKRLDQAQARVKLLEAFVETMRELVEALGEGREYEDWGLPIRAACVALAALTEGEKNEQM